MGELDAPSVPTYCSMYRARCWGNRRRHGRDFLRKGSSARTLSSGLLGMC